MHAEEERKEKEKFARVTTILGMCLKMVARAVCL